MTPLRQRILVALFGGCLVLCALRARAAEAPDASLKSPAWLAPKATAKRPKVVAAGPSVSLGRSLCVLLFASVLGGSALYLRNRKKHAPALAPAQLRVVGSTKLGGNAKLVLAEVNGRKILLGVTDRSVQKLGWIAEETEEEELAPAAQPRSILSGIDLATRVQRVPVRATETPVVAKRSFRDRLASAVGNLGNHEQESAAQIIAAETEDSFSRATPRKPEIGRASGARRAANPEMIDLEGQAKGLLARLGEPRA